MVHKHSHQIWESNLFDYVWIQGPCFRLAPIGSLWTCWYSHDAVFQWPRMQCHLPEDSGCFWPSDFTKNSVVNVWLQVLYYQQSVRISICVIMIFWESGDWDNKLQGVCQWLSQEQGWDGWGHLVGNQVLLKFNHLWFFPVLSLEPRKVSPPAFCRPDW